MGGKNVFSKVEEGNWGSFLIETENKRQRSLRITVIVYKVFLVLLSLAGLVVYVASAGAISCRMLDNMIRSENCHVAAQPFASLWQASIYTMIALNGAAAAVFLQCLMLTFRLGEIQSAWPEKQHEKVNIFSVNEIETCNIHDDFILKLMYRTRCCDDVVIRAQFPAPRRCSSRLRLSQMRDSAQYVTRTSEPQHSILFDLRNRRPSSRRQSQPPEQEAAQQIPMVVSEGSVQIDETGLGKRFYDR